MRWMCAVASLGVSALLLANTGWNEFPPYPWRQFAVLWATGDQSYSLLIYATESILPLLLVGVCILALFPIGKQLFYSLKHEQVTRPIQRIIPIDHNAPLLLPAANTTSDTVSEVCATLVIEKDTEAELPNEQKGEKQEAVITIPSLPHRQQETGVKICISLLGEMKVWLEINGEQLTLPIKSHRRQELLAYIATHAPSRDRGVSSGRILTDVFEHILPGADVDNLRGLFQKHTQLLRKEINEVVQEAGFPKVKLFQFEKSSNSSTKWWLSEECKF